MILKADFDICKLFFIPKMAKTGKNFPFFWKFGFFRTCLFFGRSFKSLQKFGKSIASDSEKLKDANKFGHDFSFVLPMLHLCHRMAFVFLPQLLDRFYSYGGDHLRPKPFYDAIPYEAGDLLAGTVSMRNS